ncbi:vWA domain-containing protein [Moorena producens]|uniref:vWA domain-containing protein n=1 Tax=Moorena producens TaxID=1155739 RepID=UPI003C736520
MTKKSIALSTTIVSWTRKLSWLLLCAGCFSYPSRVQAQEAKIVNATVDDEKVKIRIQVKNEYDQPVTNLTYENFQVYVNNDPVPFKPKHWKNPTEAEQPSAWIIFLLDMSGSMKYPDQPGSSQSKLEGAIKAIREFINATADRSSDTQVAIVPFGEAGSKYCQDGGYPVNEAKLNKFFPVEDSDVEDSDLQEYLRERASKTPCAATNIYEPLSRAVDFLSEERGDPRFYLKKDKFWQPDPQQPRLSIILLSDGFHNQPNEEQDFERLKRLIKINDNIILHTLGYGLKPGELGDKYGLGREATRDDARTGRVPAEEFVDRDRLDEISRITGGICQISGNAQEVAKSLELFLDALLGEYEITYTDPNPIRAERHHVQVKVDSRHVSTGRSEPKAYRITSFGWSLSFPIRLALFVGTFVVMGVGGAVPFYFWGEYLKRKEDKD